MYKKIVAHLQDYFGISRKEARGALVLMVICCLVLFSPFVFRRWILPHFQSQVEPVDMRKLDSLAAELENENKVTRKSRRNYAENDLKKEGRPVGKPFDFDPNTVSVDGLQQLGVPAFLAKRIEKFRGKGGKFRRKEDLLKIYDFPAELYRRLEPHIKLSESLPQKEHITTNSTGINPVIPGNNASPERRSNVSKPGLEAFDINQADTTQLMRLRGIGSKLSARIVKFRDALGGFYSTSQYPEIFGLDSLALAELSCYAKVISPVSQIPINTVTSAELGRHSYFRDRKMVSVIINYRTQHGPYQNIDDLRKTKVVDENLIRKIAPYLTF